MPYAATGTGSFYCTCNSGYVGDGLQCYEQSTGMSTGAIVGLVLGLLLFLLLVLGMRLVDGHRTVPMLHSLF
jgi:hypothetical protein